MKTLTQIITEIIPTGCNIVETAESKTSQYFYISSEKRQYPLKCRLSNHEPMTVNSKSDVQVICNESGLHLEVDFDTVWDNDGYEAELTKSDVVEQLKDLYNIDIQENDIDSFDQWNVVLDFIPSKTKMSDVERIDIIIANYFSSKL